MWAYSEDGVTVTQRVTTLPRNFKNYSNIAALTNDELRAIGWYPFIESRPPISPTERHEYVSTTITDVITDVYTNAAIVMTAASIMSKLEFRSRFFVEELVGIEMARLGHASLQVRATLQVLSDNMLVATEIDLGDPRTAQGINALVSFGLLTDARAVAILTP